MTADFHRPCPYGGSGKQQLWDGPSTQPNQRHNQTSISDTVTATDHSHPYTATASTPVLQVGYRASRKESLTTS